MQLYQGSEAKAQAILIGLGKGFAQDLVENETRFELRASQCVLNRANAIAQVQLPGALLDRTKQALEAPTQVGSLADVRFGLSVLATKQKDGGRGRNAGKGRGIAFGNEFQALSQHEVIVV